MEEIEKTDIEKATELLKKVQDDKLKAFNEELTALCEKYQFSLSVKYQIIIIPKND